MRHVNGHIFTRLTVSQDNVRRAIESHLLDSSPAVRDAAIELIRKYIVDFPHLASNYHRQIADRIAVSSAQIKDLP